LYLCLESIISSVIPETLKSSQGNLAFGANGSFVFSLCTLVPGLLHAEMSLSHFTTETNGGGALGYLSEELYGNSQSK